MARGRRAKALQDSGSVNNVRALFVAAVLFRIAAGGVRQAQPGLSLLWGRSGPGRAALALPGRNGWCWH